MCHDNTRSLRMPADGAELALVQTGEVVGMSGAALQPKRVLLVEDHSLVRAGMKTMLHMAEPELLVMESGSYDDALCHLKQGAFDIVLLDIDLRAEKSGLDLLEQVREMDLTVKVIMLSASDDKDTVLNCLSRGASGYIAKSSGDQSVFVEALNTVLSDGVFLPSTIISESGDVLPPTLRALTPRTLRDYALSPRLTQALFYLCQGMSNKSIARQMGISEGTVRKTYVSDLLRIFNVTRRTELIIEVSRLGLRIPRPVLKEQAPAAA